MNIDKSTCWYQNCAKEMNAFFYQYHKPFTKDELIEKVYHMKIFNKLVRRIAKDITNVLDLGCGTGVMSKFFDIMDYTGSDIPEIIENSAKRNFPKHCFISKDIYEDDLYFLKCYSLVFMSGFIDIMEFPLLALNNIIHHCSNYVILHRQEISESKETHCIKNDSYGGKTYHSIINRNDLNMLLKKHNFKIIKEYNLDYSWENGGSSFLLRRI